jgi:hypothetical protein
MSKATRENFHLTHGEKMIQLTVDFFFFNPKLGKPEVLQSFSFKVEEKELSTQNSIPSRNQHIYDERKLRGLVYNKPTLKE